MDSDGISSDIERRARELCEQISVAHDLDADIQEELYTHVEDKLLGYLSGEVPVTEDDALILVREHFGDIRTIKSLMHDVHVEEVTISQTRRWLAAVIATLACGIVGGVLLDFVSFSLHYYHITTLSEQELVRASSSMNLLLGLGAFNPLFTVPLYLVIAVITTLSPWVLFYCWKRYPDHARNRWIHCWSIKKMASIIGILLVVTMMIPHLAPLWVGSGSQTEIGVLFFIGCTLTMRAGQCLAWIWWCDSVPRTKRNVLNSALLWLIFVSSLTFALPRTFSRLTAEVLDVSTTTNFTLSSLVLYRGHFFDTPFFLNIVWRVPSVENWGYGGPTLMYTGFSCALAIGSYWLYRFRNSRRQRNSFDGPDRLA